MHNHTKSYVTLRTHSQQTLDFAVLVCTAAPQLRYALNEFQADPTTFLATNSQFRPSNEPYATEKRTLSSYKKVLGANLLLSVFSYFETYFFSVIDEMIDFHGGKDELLRLSSKQVSGVDISSENNETSLNQLRKPYKPNRADRFRKFSSSLRGEKVIWPTQRLMLYGLSQMLENKKRWKSADIPKLMRNLLCMDVEESTESRFHNVRDERNKIAHGKNLSYDLTKAVDVSNYFRELAMEIDQHICRNFMVIEKFVH